MNFNLLSDKINNIEEGNNVILPQEILKEITESNYEITTPYFFEISTDSLVKTFVGVKDFTAEVQTIQIPEWLYNQMGISSNEIVNVKLIENIPKGKFIKIKPLDETFFEVPDYENCLEIKLSEFPILFEGQIIQLDIFDIKYDILIEQVDPDWDLIDLENSDEGEFNIIDVINVDLNVDITNSFLHKKLEEEKKKKEIQKETLKENHENNEKDNSGFNSIGYTLSHDSKEITEEEIRKARLKYYTK